MCEEFILAASAPAFSFIYTLYATLTGDGVTNRAKQAAEKIKGISNLNDSQFRATVQIISGYGRETLLITGLIATVLSYITALFSSRNVFGSSQLYGLSIVATPILLLIFCIMVISSVGMTNLFTHKVLSPFKRLGGRATLPFTYGSAMNAGASLCNALLIMIFALTYGVLSCAPQIGAATQTTASNASHAIDAGSRAGR